MSAGTRSWVNKVLCPDCNGKHRQKARVEILQRNGKAADRDRKKIKLILFPTLNLVNSPGMTHMNSCVFLGT